MVMTKLGTALSPPYVSDLAVRWKIVDSMSSKSLVSRVNIDHTCASQPDWSPIRRTLLPCSITEQFKFPLEINENSSHATRLFCVRSQAIWDWHFRTSRQSFKLRRDQRLVNWDNLKVWKLTARALLSHRTLAKLETWKHSAWLPCVTFSIIIHAHVKEDLIEWAATRTIVKWNASYCQVAQLGKLHVAIYRSGTCFTGLSRENESQRGKPVRCSPWASRGCIRTNTSLHSISRLTTRLYTHWR